MLQTEYVALLQVLEPVANTPLTRSQSDGPSSSLPAVRQEMTADGQAAPRGRDSVDNDNVQSGLQGTPSLCDTSWDQVLVHPLIKENSERYIEITQALEQDLPDSRKSSSPSMHKGKAP